MTRLRRVLTIVSVQNITCGLFHHHLRILPSAVNASWWVNICALLWKWELRNNNSLTKMWFRLSRVASVTSQETSFLAMQKATVISLTQKYSKLASECTWLVAVRQHGIPVGHSNQKRKWFYRSFYSDWFSANHSHFSQTDTGFEFPASNYPRETPSSEIRVYQLPSNHSAPMETDLGFEFPTSNYPLGTPFRWKSGVSVAEQPFWSEGNGPRIRVPRIELPWHHRNLSQLVSFPAMFFWPGDRQTN